MPNFMKIRPLGAEMYHADGRTDMMKLTVAFHNFANMPNKVSIFMICWNQQKCHK